MRAIRKALKPGGRLAKVCWRRKADSPLWAKTEQVVERFLSRPDEYEADTCGPGPFSPGYFRDHPRNSLRPPGSTRLSCTSATSTTLWARTWDEAIDSLLAIGPGAELIRLNGEHGECHRSEIAAALRDHYKPWQTSDGSIVGRASVWIVAAINPG